MKIEPAKPVTIRLAAESDRPLIITILTKVWGSRPDTREWVLRDAANPAIKWFVAEQDDTPIGVASWMEAGIDGNDASLCWLSVLPKHRHDGVATALLDGRLAAVQRWLAGCQGYAYALVKQPAHNYRNRGFVPLHDRGNKGWLMVKTFEGRDAYPLPPV